ncbi:hypothetical protein RJD24_02425 [Bacillaceae bacterium IKA-2]|nr:hypothetical protein RJD24_02425 [Bacillaceae bacterium IKA-2]
MKKLLLVILFIMLAGTAIFYGNSQYKNKLSLTNERAQAEISRYQEESEEQVLQKEMEEQERLERLVGNVSPELEEKIMQVLAGGEPLKVVAMGSRALTGKGDLVPWPEIIEERVNKLYGINLFNVETLAFGKDNTFDVVGGDKHLEAALLNPDIVILEPFIWNNNGYARMEDTLYHIGEMVRVFKEENEDVIIFIQPGNPIYNATLFQQQVASVKEYSLEQGLLYFDHWEKWPDTSDEILKSYLIEDDDIPNQSGHDLWADYLVRYFVAE